MNFYTYFSPKVIIHHYDFFIMLTTILKTVFITQLIGQIIIRAPFQIRARHNQIIKNSQTTVDKLLIGFTVLGMMVLPLLYIFSPWLDSFNYAPRFSLVTWGLVTYIVGLWLFWRSHKDLGINWSITTKVRKNHTLVTNGVYYNIRHPMYAAIWLFAFAQPCILTNWVAGFSGLLTFSVLYTMRIGEEERLMIEVFGKKYIDYMGKTGRLMPRTMSRKL